MKSRGAKIFVGMFGLLLGIWGFSGNGVELGRNENQHDKSREFGIWSPGMLFEQSFRASQDRLCRIDVAIDSYHAWETPYLVFRLYALPEEIDPAEASYHALHEKRQPIRSKRLNGWLISPHTFQSISFAAIPVSAGKPYLFTLESPEVSQGGTSILLGSPEDRYEEGALFVNGEKQEGDLAFRALYQKAKLQIIRDIANRLALQKPFPFSMPIIYYLIGIAYITIVVSVVCLTIKKI